jgi:hypothetical protein
VLFGLGKAELLSKLFLDGVDSLVYLLLDLVELGATGKVLRVPGALFGSQAFQRPAFPS